MSSITLKLTSLVVKTLSKPIANQIKAQAREHARFRRICISFAQSLHRVDMRLRLGLLQDTAALERQAAKEAAAEAQAAKLKKETPTVKTEAQTKADEKAKTSDKTKTASVRPRIRPLSEAKAIDTGANFISETFLFLVGGSLIVFESFRSRRKAATRREDVADRLSELEESEKNARRALVALEKELLRTRAEVKAPAAADVKHILPPEVWQLEEREEREDEERSRGLWARTVKLLGGGPEQRVSEKQASQGGQDARGNAQVSLDSTRDTKETAKR